MSDQQKQLFNKPPRVVHCERCHAPCRVADRQNPDARLLRASLTGKGYCVNCGVTEFLKFEHTVGTITRRCEECGDCVDAQPGEIPCRCDKPQPADPRKFFGLPHVQEQFAAIMSTGGADASPEEIDWDEVIANWDLPFPKHKKHR